MSNHEKNTSESRETSVYTVSAFVPWRRRDDGDLEFFLQRRDNNPGISNQNTYALFGGHIEEGETPSQAFLRETKEELEYIPTNVLRIRKPQKDSPDVTGTGKTRMQYLFAEKVGKDFEDNITIKEGQPYGPDGSRFMTITEMEKHEAVPQWVIQACRTIQRALQSKS